MMPSELSGGMRKRIALARTLIVKPDVILCDESTTGLDPITAREISHLIVKVQKKYYTSSLIISHDMNCIEITSNRVAIGVLLTDTTASKNLSQSIDNIEQGTGRFNENMEALKSNFLFRRYFRKLREKNK
ncbi:MAG TPA: ATP-binding cassette domain-containing protein [Cyclobacteriaceae bacterium]|nr:ATP-binding cassette domain-containing protein [Cyclobacteriaceae bacterium]